MQKLYQSSLMQPLHIKEHTAQLGREEQQKYQEMFINKEINALSCSTTFEMVLTWVIWRLYTCGICLLHRQTMCKEQDAQVAVKNAAAFSLYIC